MNGIFLLSCILFYLQKIAQKKNMKNKGLLASRRTGISMTHCHASHPAYDTRLMGECEKCQRTLSTIGTGKSLGVLKSCQR